MKPAIIAGQCRLMGHGENCRICRSNPEWRAFMQTPEICPHGIKIEDAPSFRVKMKKKDCRTCAPVEVVFRVEHFTKNS